MQVENYTDIDVGVDLVAAAVDQVQFLQQVNKHPCLYEGPVLQRAIWRYKDLWLPLAAEHSDELLSAPLDIEWAWHCHMLAPVAYQRDCLSNHQKIVDHNLRFKSEYYQQSLAFSEKYWNQKYPDKPFNVDLDGHDLSAGQGQSSRSYELSYDLEAAARRQKVFYYQVSLPHYVDPKFLEKSLSRYMKFLFLKQKNPGTFLVPCYDMDLMWHSHMNFPLSYKAVTELLLGTTLNHDDSVNDRSEGSRLNRSDARTRQLWKGAFNEHFSSFGAMYRGDPPTGKLETIEREDMFRLVSKNVEVAFSKVEVEGHARQNLGKFKLYLTEKSELLLSSRYQGEKELVDFSEKLIMLKGPQFSWNHAGTITKYVNCMDSDNLRVQIKKAQSFLCFSSGSGYQAEGIIDLNSLSARLTDVGQKVTENTVIHMDSDLAVELELTLTLKKLGTVDLWLVPGEYEDCVMPEQIEQLWGPVPLPRLPPGVDNNCSVASHKMKTFEGKIEFTCRVVHSLPLMMSSVQVFFHDKMAAVAHVIGSDQIPNPDDVSDQAKCVTLDQKQGERAMIIKNTHGDWGIIVGRWDGFKVGRPGARGSRHTPGRAGIPGQPGFLTLLLYKMTTKKWELLSMEDPYLTEEFRFNMGDARVDMKIGKISIKGDNNQIAEHLALSFCVSLLHVFLQPRPANWEPGQSLEPQVNKRGMKPVRHIKAEKLAFVLAAGLLIATPTNLCIRKKLRDRQNAFGAGGIIGTHDDHQDDRGRNNDEDDGNARGIFGGGRDELEDGTRAEDIATQLMGDSNDDNADTGGHSLLDDMYGQDEFSSGNRDQDDYGERYDNDANEVSEGIMGTDNDHGLSEDYGYSDYGTGDGYSDLGGTDYGTETDMYGEDFNTFVGDFDYGIGSNEGIDSGGFGGSDTGGGGDGGGWSFGGGNDGDAGGCGGCGAGCGGGGVFGTSIGMDTGGGGGDSGGGGGAFSGVGYSGGAFDSGDGGGGDSGGGGGWLDGFSGMDSGGGGGGDGGGWGGDSGGGGGDGGGGGGDGGGGGCGGCGG